MLNHGAARCIVPSSGTSSHVEPSAEMLLYA